MSLDGLLRRTASSVPDKLAVVDDASSVTWREFDALVDGTAAYLTGLGTTSGDRVAILAGNGIPFTAAVWACWRMGAVAVPLNHRLRAEELAALIGHSGSRALLVGGDKRDFARSIDVPKGTRVCVSDEWLQASESPSASPVVAVDAPAAILYTSGTTGTPKGVVLSHGNIEANCSTCTDVIGRTSDDVELIMVPQFNVTGLCSQTVPAVATGATSVLIGRFNEDAVIGLIRRWRVSVTVGPPTMWWRITDAAATDDLDSIRLALFGGAPMPSALLAQMRAIMPRALFGNGYGMTETCSMVAFAPDEVVARRADSIGMILPGVEARVLDPDSHVDVAAGRPGQLFVRGPQVGLGYWTSEQIRPFVDSEGFLATGDLVSQSDELLVMAGRLKDVIKRGGESVFPVEVEESLADLDGVGEVAVTGVPNHLWGELVAAFVVPRAGSRLTADEVRAHCRGRLAPFKVPGVVVMLDELPRNAGGKVVKSELLSLVPITLEGQMHE